LNDPKYCFHEFILPPIPHYPKRSQVPIAAVRTVQNGR
jgi:hypothetical protein